MLCQKYLSINITFVFQMNNAVEYQTQGVCLRCLGYDEVFFRVFCLKYACANEKNVLYLLVLSVFQFFSNN